MSQAESINAVPRTRAQAAAWVVEQVRTLGMNPNPASRLVRMQRILERGLVPFEDHPLFTTALEAMRELQELAFVFGEAGGHLGAPKYLALVKDLLKDSVLSKSDRKKSPGRDAQLELYLAAVCQHAGLSPVGYEEPDVTCTVDTVTFGIAAKRLKSGTASAVREHVKKAADQIKRAGHPGFIVLDLTQARNQDNQPIVSQIQSQLFEMVAAARNRQFFEEHEQDIYRWVDGSGVRGVLVLDSRVRLRPDRQWGVDGTVCWLPTTQGDEQAGREYAAFYEGFLKGFPKLVDHAKEG